MKYTCLACRREFERFNKKGPDYVYKYCSRQCCGKARARRIDLKKLLELRRWGLSQDAIGARLRCSQSVVSRALQRLQLA